MRSWREALRRALHPGPAALTAIVFLAAALVPLFALDTAQENVPLMVAVCAFATYALAALIVSAVGVGKRAAAFVRRRAPGDETRRAAATIGISLVANTAFALFKAVAALREQSPWIGSMAFYYMMLALGRFFLLRAITAPRERQEGDWASYTRCGWLLLLVTVALAGLNALAAQMAGSAVYEGYLIYAMAAFAFFSVGMAAHGFLRWKNMRMPPMLACKAVSLVTALASVYFVQTALLETFGEDTLFRTTMNAASGSALVIGVTAISIAMILRGRRMAGLK